MKPTEILTEVRTGSMAWRSDTALQSNGVVSLDTRCRDELEKVAQVLVNNPLPSVLVESDAFELPHCQRAIADIRHRLESDPGFVVVERLPVEQYDYDVIVKLYWLIMSMVGRPVAQKYDGEMIYDVTDTGKKATAGSGIRSSKTNAGQVYHNDNSFNVPPHYVGLLCLRPAVEGGESGLITVDSVYNRLLEKFPEVLSRLYRPFYFDRQREHSPDEELVSWEPVFKVQGNELHARLATNLIRQGYVLMDKAVDSETDRALDALDEVLESEDLGKTFDFTPGQIQIVNNRRLGHRRTAFTDAADPAQKRHLVRIWLRDEGQRFYQG